MVFKNLPKLLIILVVSFLRASAFCPPPYSMWSWHSNPRVTFGDHVKVNMSIVNCTEALDGSSTMYTKLVVRDENFFWGDCPDSRIDLSAAGKMTYYTWELFKQKKIGLRDDCFLNHIFKKTHIGIIANMVGHNYILAYNTADNTIDMGMSFVGIKIDGHFKHTIVAPTQFRIAEEAAKLGIKPKHPLAAILGLLGLCLCATGLCLVYCSRGKEESHGFCLPDDDSSRSEWDSDDQE